MRIALAACMPGTRPRDWWLGLTLLLAVSAYAGETLAEAIAVNDRQFTRLQLTERIDSARIGGVSVAEQSVLRAEWRSAAASADETQALQHLLERLQRIQKSVNDLSGLMLTIPTPTSPTLPGVRPPQTQQSPPPYEPVAALKPAEQNSSPVDQSSRPDIVLRLIAITAALGLFVTLWLWRRSAVALAAKTTETNLQPLPAGVIQEVTARKTKRQSVTTNDANAPTDTASHA